MLEDLKAKLIEVAREAEACGLCKAKTGNFSIRDEKTGYVIVTPSGIERKDLDAKNICIIDVNGNVIETEKGIKPSSEVLVHLQIYKTRPDVKAVVHTHSLNATVFAILNKCIPPVVYEAINYGGYVYVAPYGRPGTKELAESVINPLSKSDACLLERHGVIAIGKDIDEAFLKARYVEEVAELYYKSLLLNNNNESNIVEVEEMKLWEYPKEIRF